jgi:7-cyano-7-deazaguanine synthase in queuosine biosynthesis
MTPREYVYDFSRAGNISGGVEQDMLFDDMPALAEYYVNDSNLAIPFGTRLSPLLADWIDVAVASYFADRFAIRRTKAGSRQYHWGRAIRLRIGVRQPDIWRRPEVLKSLSGLLGFITGDKWEFEFVEYQGEPRFSELNGQANLFPLEGPTLVALFSGGLDSFAGVAQFMSAKHEHEFVLVSGVTNSRQQAGQRRQVRAIADQVGRSPTHVTVPLRRSWREVQQPEEWSQRGRGFLFLTLGSATAVALQNQELFVFENGIGAINLPINGTQIGTYNSRAVNPTTLYRMSQFVRVLTGESFTIRNPFLLYTKGQMCRHAALAGLAAIVSETFSCDGFPVHTHACPQCGTCSSCVLRRLSLLRANLKEYDSGYLVDVYDPAKSLSQDQQYVLRAMYWQARTINRHLQSSEPWQTLIRAFPSLNRIEDALVTNCEMDRSQLRSEMLRLYQEYVSEWNEFQCRCPLFANLRLHAA